MYDIIKKRRGELGLHQYDLADKLGVSRATINYLENGKYPGTNLRLLKKVCKELDVSLVECLGLENLKIKPTTKEEWILLKTLIEKEIEQCD